MLLRADLYPLFSPFLWVPFQGHRSRTDCFYSLLTQVPVDFSYSLGCAEVFLPISSNFLVRVVPLVCGTILCLCLIWHTKNWCAYWDRRVSSMSSFCHLDISPPSQCSWSVIFCEFYIRLIIILWLFINLFSLHSLLPCVIFVYSSTFLPVHRLTLVMVSSLCYRLCICYLPFIY